MRNTQKFLCTMTIVYMVLCNFSTLRANELTDFAPISPPDIVAEAAVLIDAETGLVLYEKNKDAQLYPASVTKIMTALLTVEQLEADDIVAFSYNAVYSLPRDASHIAMDEGETLLVSDALYGLMLASANEVANALAEKIAGTCEDFADLMNKRAQAIGAVNTHFENPSGLHQTNHYTTAYDIAVILRESIKHSLFTEVIAARRHDIPPTERLGEVRALLNTNKLIQPGSYYNEWVVGGKTGFTDEAGHTLAAYAVKDGRPLIAVVLRDEKSASFTDVNALFDYGFAMAYENALIFDHTAYALTVPVVEKTSDAASPIDNVMVKGAVSLSFPLPETVDLSEVRYVLDIAETFSPPVYAGQTVGNVDCYIRDLYVGTVPLLAVNTVQDAASDAQNTTTSGPQAATNDTQAATDDVQVATDDAQAATDDAQVVTDAFAYNQEPSLIQADGYTPEDLAEMHLYSLWLPICLMSATFLFSIALFGISRRHQRKRILRMNREPLDCRYVYRYKD